ncbi:hypothetical protein [Herpetosiphon giganteus]|uniref:hypothetical protein n=1 Tax=Herpetosiphon giganteus TaxID=2029754 RepID=UPI00195C53A4|nr:hypothetical protein [Herpetosiphon giganteus]MBM7841989.1 hypothetical protein [Herpetosiphon giganteus]
MKCQSQKSKMRLLAVGYGLWEQQLRKSVAKNIHGYRKIIGEIRGSTIVAVGFGSATT